MSEGCIFWVNRETRHRTWSHVTTTAARQIRSSSLKGMFSKRSHYIPEKCVKWKLIILNTDLGKCIAQFKHFDYVISKATPTFFKGAPLTRYPNIGTFVQSGRIVYRIICIFTCWVVLSHTGSASAGHYGTAVLQSQTQIYPHWNLHEHSRPIMVEHTLIRASPSILYIILVNPPVLGSPNDDRLLALLG